MSTPKWKQQVKNLVSALKQLSFRETCVVSGILYQCAALGKTPGDYFLGNFSPEEMIPLSYLESAKFRECVITLFRAKESYTPHVEQLTVELIRRLLEVGDEESQLRDDTVKAYVRDYMEAHPCTG